VAIRIDPTAAAYNARCWSLTLAGRDLARALADCTESLRLHPGYDDALNSRGLVWLKLGVFDRAIDDYGAVVSRNPRDAESLYGRGFAKLKRGDAAGGNADLAMARAIRANIVEIYIAYGVK
jgi:tetratricopeptide (TPR) repeat protein